MHGVGGHQTGLLQDRASLFLVGADETHDHRHLTGKRRQGADNAPRYLIATGNAAKDVEEDCCNVLVIQDDMQGVFNTLRAGAAANVEKIGRTPAAQFDGVHGRHGEAGAIDDTADGAVELHKR